LFSQPGEDVFIFADPPYYSVKKSKLYGKDGILHTSFDHDRLFETIKTSNHKVLLTYDNCDFIMEKYKDFNIKSWELQYGMNSFCNANASKGKEVIITNF
jgi:DNA adenine methylase